MRRAAPFFLLLLVATACGSPTVTDVRPSETRAGAAGEPGVTAASRQDDTRTETELLAALDGTPHMLWFWAPT